MLVGTILLTKDNKYVTDGGKLPTRPKHDKGLLAGLVKNQTLSEHGYIMLPQSMQKTCVVNMDKPLDYSVPIAIDEIAESDLLIISRSIEEFEGGKTFRLDNFKCLVKDRKVELWIRIQ